MADISDLKFDDKNFNKHTEFGMSKLEESLRNYGAGRSILIDKDNNIIAGNGIIESAGQIGLNKVRIVETTGDEIVAVNIYAHLLAQESGKEIELLCAIGDENIAGTPYSKVVEIAGNYIKNLGGFEKLAEWGLF